MGRRRKRKRPRRREPGAGHPTSARRSDGRWRPDESARRSAHRRPAGLCS